MFEFPCIITLYYIKNQQDATLAVLGYDIVQWQLTSDILTGYIHTYIYTFYRSLTVTRQ